MKVRKMIHDLHNQDCYSWSILLLKSVYCKGSSSEALATILSEGGLIQQDYYHLTINHLSAGKWKFGTRIASSEHSIQIDSNGPEYDSASFLILEYMKVIQLSNSILIYKQLILIHTDDAPTSHTCCRVLFLLQFSKHTLFCYSTFTIIRKDLATGRMNKPSKPI